MSQMIGLMIVLLSLLMPMQSQMYGNANGNMDGVNYERKGYDGFNYNINNGYSNNGFYAPPPPPPQIPFPVPEYNNGPMPYNNGPQPQYNNGPMPYNNGPQPQYNNGPMPYNNGPQPQYNNGPQYRPMPSNRNYRPYAYDELDNYNLDLYARYSTTGGGYSGAPYRSSYRPPMKIYPPAATANSKYNNNQYQPAQYGSNADNNINNNYNQNRFVAPVPSYNSVPSYNPAPVVYQPAAPTYEPYVDSSQQLYTADYYSTLNDLAAYDPVLAKAIDIYIKNKNKNWNDNKEKLATDSSAYNANANANSNADQTNLDGSLNYQQQQPSYGSSATYNY